MTNSAPKDWLCVLAMIIESCFQHAMLFLQKKISLVSTEPSAFYINNIYRSLRSWQLLRLSVLNCVVHCVASVTCPLERSANP